MNTIMFWAGWSMLLLGLPVLLIGILAKDWAMKPAPQHYRKSGR